TLVGSDADGNALTYTIVFPPAHGLLVPAAPGSPSLTYTPTADYNGPDTFTYVVHDGHVNSNETGRINVTIAAVNDAPSFSAGPNQTVAEDSGANTVPNWATGISAGPADESGQTLTFSVTGNTSPGLFAAGPAVATNGTLTYTPATNVFGSATITLRLQDNGGTANGGIATGTHTFTITVTGVNHAPSFTAGANVTVLEDAGAQSVSGWATGISPGPNESFQTVTFNVTTNTNPSLFSTPPAVSPAGTLTFTPAASTFGSSTFTVQLQDNGCSANRGTDVVTHSFTIGVTNVNHAPSFTAGPNVTVNEDSGPATSFPWATGISAGPNESGQTLTFNVTNNTNPSLFAAGPSVGANGGLSFT